MPQSPERKFNVGDKIRVNLHRGKIEDAVVKAVINETDGVKLQVDVVGLDLTALIETCQVIKVLTSLLSNKFIVESPDDKLSVELDVDFAHHAVPNHFRINSLYFTHYSSAFYEYRIDGTRVFCRLIEDWHKEPGVPEYQKTEWCWNQPGGTGRRGRIGFMGLMQMTKSSQSGKKLSGTKWNPCRGVA